MQQLDGKDNHLYGIPVSAGFGTVPPTYQKLDREEVKKAPTSGRSLSLGRED